MTVSRTIMIVGNGRVDPAAAAAIDAADLVIRFNDCRSCGAGGQKTDIVAVCNTGRPAMAMLGGGGWKTNTAVRQAREIWCVRSSQVFDALRPRLAVSHPDLADLCDDYTDGFRAFAKATGRAFHVIPPATHAAVDADLARFGAEDYVVPSSGLITIAEVLAHWRRPSDQVVLAGFGHAGWEWHPFAAERRYVDDSISKGHLVRLDHTIISAFAQGA
ncbi:MAG TPA: Urease operon accessory protein [Pararhizobium sp.]|uniref:Urease operon accessory protein n=1 Tax=Pararhizobium sp. TaxID=1977563 RepID=UPI002BA05E3A|nr:Urease operon accessory protein [Pararhizobium sp.]HTO31714.1 Urease operon accessory protein [Pararhizobium sp.]